MARGRGGGGSSPKKPRKGVAYPQPALLDLACPGALLLLINGVIAIHGAKVRVINQETYEYLLEHEWITHPIQVDDEICKCSFTQAGRKIAQALQSKDTGFDQLVFQEFKELFNTEEETTNALLIV